VAKAFQIKTKDPTLLFLKAYISVRPTGKNQNEHYQQRHWRKNAMCDLSGKTGTQKPLLVQKPTAPS
jgi:hypothetical protein